jgi:SAM-dependent methyltransferase
MLVQNRFSPKLDARLNLKRIRLLSEQGSGYDPRWYSSSIDFYYKSTNEKKVIAEFALRSILPTIKRERMLDIGFGDGRLTRFIGRHFDEVVAYEKYPEDFRNAEGRSLSGKAGFTAIRARYPDENALPGHFDFVLASHILYYSQPDSWTSLAESAMDATRSGGAVLFVSLDEESDAGKFIAKMGGGYPTNGFAEKCAEKFGAQIFVLESIIRAFDQKDAIRLSQFLLFDVLDKVGLPGLVEDVEANFKKEDGTYEIKNSQIAVLIRQ